MSIDLQQFKKLHTSAAKKYMVARGLKPKSSYVTDKHRDEFFAALKEFYDYVEHTRENLTTDEALSAFRNYLEKWPLYGLASLIFRHVDTTGSFNMMEKMGLLKSLDDLFYLTYDFG